MYFVTLVLAALQRSARSRRLLSIAFFSVTTTSATSCSDSNRMVIAGLACLALAMCGCLLLVTTKLFGVSAGVVTAALGAVPFVLLWFVLPLRRLRLLDSATRLEVGSASAASPNGW